MEVDEHYNPIVVVKKSFSSVKAGTQASKAPCTASSITTKVPEKVPAKLDNGTSKKSLTWKKAPEKSSNGTSFKQS